MAEIINHERHSIVFGRKIIDFKLLYCERKTIEISVYPDSSVIVKAPIETDQIRIGEKVLKRAGWIIKQLSYFKQFNPRTPARCYVSGETHMYLGKQYRLKLLAGEVNSVRLSRGYFYVTCLHETTPDIVKKQLNKWYSEKANVHFSESIERCWLKFKPPGLYKPKLSVRRMQKRWGSLSDKGTLTLNTELIKAPKKCIDYVVTHELCHLVYHDHSSEFYKLLESIIPDWRKIKHKLELITS
ncbi:MAG: M48 family metallopeptidase [Cyclonatronaceae bacterium]